jgi:hypothetical protein
MSFFSSAISRLARLRYRKIQDWLDNPLTAQRDLFQELLTNGQHTEFGRKYQFNQIFTVTEFKKAVPIHEYENLRPLIERIMKGEQNLLWNTPVNWFAKSSGTTGGKSKFIPVTKESLEDNHYQASKDVITFYYRKNPESNLLTGKGLVVGGSHQISQLDESIFYGDLSAVLMQNSPFWGHWIRTPDLSIALMDEWESKIEAMAHCTAKEKVTSLSGVPTWTYILGKRILEITGKQCLKEVWPDLQVYLHGGVAFTPYKDQFQKLCGPGVRYMEMYNASEGFFAAHDNTDADGMLLFLNHGIFYEFMPIEEYGKNTPQTLSLQQVEKNKMYAPVISTNGGLWRYITGDTITFTSLNPWRIRVAGRLKHFINVFGEEVIVDNTDKALADACRKTNAFVNDYSVGPVYFSDAGQGAHEWLIEFENEPNDLATFTTLLDTCLQELNSDYEAKRYKNIALQRPIIRVMRKGFFHDWLKKNGKLGGQHKVPRLTNDRNLIDDMLSFLTQP